MLPVGIAFLLLAFSYKKGEEFRLRRGKSDGRS